MYHLYITRSLINEEFKLKTVKEIKDKINQFLFSGIEIVTQTAIRNLVSRPEKIKAVWKPYVKITKLKRTVLFVEDK